MSNKPKMVHQCNNIKVTQKALKGRCACGTRKKSDRCISNCVKGTRKNIKCDVSSVKKVRHKKVDCLAREKS